MQFECESMCTAFLGNGCLMMRTYAVPTVCECWSGKPSVCGGAAPSQAGRTPLFALPEQIQCS